MPEEEAAMSTAGERSGTDRGGGSRRGGGGGRRGGRPGKVNRSGDGIDTKLDRGPGGGAVPSGDQVLPAWGGFGVFIQQSVPAAGGVAPSTVGAGVVPSDSSRGEGGPAARSLPSSKEQLSASRRDKLRTPSEGRVVPPPPGGGGPHHPTATESDRDGAASQLTLDLDPTDAGGAPAEPPTTQQEFLHLRQLLRKSVI